MAVRFRDAVVADPFMTIGQAEDALRAGKTTSVELLDACLRRADDPQGEGSRTYVRRFDRRARAEAASWDGMRAAGVPMPALAGIPMSVKDLFDVAGTTTTAGSVALKDAPAAKNDAPIVSRLRAAGAIIIGTTNMTEFAMGGTGLNPHYGTPLNPFERAARRIPGGSSAGAAVSICDGMAVAAIGTDTAGSVRMPAALCGIVGFKPTARRVPLAGSIPLAASLDSIGPLGSSVACCALIDAVIAGESHHVPTAESLAGLRFALPQTLVLDELAPEVARAFERALKKLSRAGANIVEIPFAELGELGPLNSWGGFSVVEGYAWHRKLLETKGALYDPIIAKRFANGAEICAADYIALVTAREDLISRSRAVTERFDAVVMPTVPIIAPEISDLESNEDLYLATGRLLIRNPGIANFFDRCALSVPCHAPGEAPVGFTLMGETMSDRRILAIGRSVEAALAS